MNQEKPQKVLVAFFSRAGENYAVGRVAKGNTQMVAEQIAARTGAACFHLEPLHPYPEDYGACIRVAQEELRAQARPALRADVAAEDYDVTLIGYPNWWGDLPMPVYTFLERHDWQGKTVAPFCTHEGSGLGHTERLLAQACPGATLLPGLAIQGTAAQRGTEAVGRSIGRWLEMLNLHLEPSWK